MTTIPLHQELNRWFQKDSSSYQSQGINQKIFNRSIMASSHYMIMKFGKRVDILKSKVEKGDFQVFCRQMTKFHKP